jgi:hypothetical protein
LLSWIRKSPVVVAHGVGAGLFWIASFLVLHGIVSKTVASATVQEIAPTVSALVIVLIGVLVQKYVVPIEKIAEHLISKYAPGMAPALDSGLEALLAGLEVSFPAPVSAPPAPAPVPADNTATQVIPAVTA